MLKKKKNGLWEKIGVIAVIFITSMIVIIPAGLIGTFIFLVLKILYNHAFP